MVSIAGVVILGYLLGTISFGTLVTRRSGVDIRAHGSGNPGTTNVIRVVGWRAGIVVGVGDVGKGALAVLIARFWPVETGCSAEAIQLGAGLAAVVGHIFPVFSHFRGGLTSQSTPPNQGLWGANTFSASIVVDRTGAEV